MDAMHSTGYEKLVVGTTAVGFELAGDGEKAQRALIRNEGPDDVRWRDDGVAPTDTDGMLLLVGEFLEHWGRLTEIQFIARSTTATIHMTGYR